MPYVLKAHTAGQRAERDSLEAAKAAAEELDLSSGATIVEVGPGGLATGREWYYPGPLSGEWTEVTPRTGLGECGKPGTSEPYGR